MFSKFRDSICRCRHAHGQGIEKVKSYKFNYSRDGHHWFTWSDYRGVDVSADTLFMQKKCVALFFGKKGVLKKKSFSPLSTCIDNHATPFHMHVTFRDLTLAFRY